MKYEVQDLTALKALAKELSNQFNFGDTIGFVGTLGAGKTTFIRYLAEALGAAVPVSSPTYVLQHEYPIQSGIIEHWDLYRLLGLPGELQEAASQKCIRFVEWSDRFPDLEVTKTICLEISSPNERRIETDF